MIIELESIFNTEGMKLPIDYSLSLAGIESYGYSPISEPAAVKGLIENKAGIVSLTGNVHLSYEAPCDRCAAEVKKDYVFPFEHTLVANLESGENDAFLEVPDLRLNLDELIEEDVNLALPSKYLCNEDCKGLCPICGKNLNESQCDCKAPVDPRFAALLELLEN